MAAKMWAKMGIVGVTLCVGGPALVYYVTPTEEELFKRYNPELQKRSLENRQQKQEDFDHFVGKLKQYSKSSKPIWEAAAEDEALVREMANEAAKKSAAEAKALRDEIKRSQGQTSR